jgi:hypothetical protein
VGAGGGAASALQAKIRKKNADMFNLYQIFTLFTLEPKSATEIW